MGYQILPGLLMTCCIVMELLPFEKCKIQKVTVLKRIFWAFWPRPLTPFINIDWSSLVFWLEECMDYQILPGLLITCCINCHLKDTNSKSNRS